MTVRRVPARFGLVVGLLLLGLCSVAALADDGYRPTWKVGDRWILSAEYRDMREQKEVWMSPVRWVFQVKSRKNVAGVECFAVYVYPENPEVKSQAILYLAVDGLRPVKVIDVFTTPEGVKHSVREFTPGVAEPLLSESSMIPYDLPVFPLAEVGRVDIQGADGFSAYRAAAPRQYRSVRRVGNLSFKRTIAQSTSAPTRQYADAFAAYRSRGRSLQVQMADERGKGNLTQLWQEGYPWAISMEGRQVRYRLENRPAADAAPAPIGGQ